MTKERAIDKCPKCKSNNVMERNGVLNTYKDMRKYRVWEHCGTRDIFMVTAESIGIAAIKALKELGYDIEQLREDEE